MKPARRTISVVIPCYNEEGLIGQCLEALAAQSRRPLEIIVVDNNCTDQTVAIARCYPNVRIVKEKTQGLMAARSTGMDVARGDIIARLDADSRPATDWLTKLARIFEDQKVQAVTGTGYFYDFPFKRASRGFRNVFAVSLNRLMLGHEMLWGSNMALRASAWRLLRHDFCDGPNIMEDLDVAMHIADEFGRDSLVYDEDLRVDISVRRGATGLVQNFLYLKMWPATLKPHRPFRSLFSWPAIGFLLATAGPFVGTVTRFYDGQNKKWTISRRQWRAQAGPKRGNP